LATLSDTPRQFRFLFVAIHLSNYTVNVINVGTTIIESVRLSFLPLVRQFAIMLVEVVGHHFGIHKMYWFSLLTHITSSIHCLTSSRISSKVMGSCRWNPSPSVVVISQQSFALRSIFSVTILQ